ncbi:MAG: hypothetical protein ACE5JT_04825 [Nitrosopumilaceae archaeon]
MTQEPLVANLKYYGISLWEIEVIYGLFNGMFEVKQDEVEEIDPDYVSVIEISIPVQFNEEFFKWFGYRRWDKVKFILKELKRRRGKGKAIKVNFNFSGKPNIRFVVDLDERLWFNNAIEKIDFLLELLPYHLDPKKLPENTTDVIYQFDTDTVKWKLHTAISNGLTYVLSTEGWKRPS